MSMASSSPLDFLTSVFAQCTAVTTPQWRPHVTLTFAQSLDAKIAGRDGKQLILSGKESMIMTHWFVPPHSTEPYLRQYQDENHARRDPGWRRDRAE